MPAPELATDQWTTSAPMDDQRADGGGQENGEDDAEQPQNQQQSIDAGDLVGHRFDRELEK